MGLYAGEVIGKQRCPTPAIFQCFFFFFSLFQKNREPRHWGQEADASREEGRNWHTFTGSWIKKITPLSPAGEQVSPGKIISASLEPTPEPL